MLFNKKNKGSQELYELTGLLYASTNYRSIASEVEHATREIARLVGEEVIRKAEQEYLKDIADDHEFLDIVRMPIALLAILNFSKQNLVSHKDTGRKLKVDDNEKVPFEWMIDRDDREQLERYYRSLDTLYSYLVKTDQEWPEKHSSKEAIVSRLCEFEEVYPISGSYYCFYMFQPLMLEVQRRQLQKFVSSDDIKAAIATPSTPLACAMREYVVLGALTKGVQRWSVSVFPTVVARSFSPSYQGNNESSKATVNEIEWFVSRIKAQMSETEKEILSLKNDGRNPYEGFPLLPENDRKNKYFTI